MERKDDSVGEEDGNSSRPEPFFPCGAQNGNRGTEGVRVWLGKAWEREGGEKIRQSRGVARIFQRGGGGGGHTVSNIIVTPIRHGIL